eukprot:jgi/Chrzof1/14449/Cz09g03110.t1
MHHTCTIQISQCVVNVQAPSNHCFGMFSPFQMSKPVPVSPPSAQPSSVLDFTTHLPVLHLAAFPIWIYDANLGRNVWGNRYLCVCAAEMPCGNRQTATAS